MDKSQTSVANYASDRFSASIREIERIKNGIYHNRKGQVTLTEIQSPDEAARLAQRIEREGLAPVDAVERINGVPNFQDVLVLRKILQLSESVCRVMIRSPFGGSGYGTGFLIAPNLIITNNHVLPDAETAQTSLAQFKYELLGTGASDPVTFKLRPDLFYMTSPIEKQITVPFSGLDFTIVAIETKSEEGIAVTDFQPVRLDKSLGKILDGENCIVIQHPAGDYKKVVLKDIRMLTLTDNFLIYESDTLPGSSGSMVVGLGTGEVVALHHSGVPRRNNQGQWLRKNGTVVEPGDPDDVIDWMGNEGIRISSILKAIAKIEIPKEMEQYRNQIFEIAAMPAPKETAVAPPPAPLSESAPAPELPQARPGGLQYFEVELSAMEALQEDWKTNARTFLTGLVKSEPIFPYASDADQRRFYYLTVKSDRAPWELAAEIEALPHIDTCTPDLPVYTDVASTGVNFGGQPTGQESAVDVIYNDGTATWNEDKFLEKWKDSVLCKAEIANKNWPAVRRWNWRAVKFTETQKDAKLWEAIKENIGDLKLVQFDTGYSTHSKVKEAYNLQFDMDFIDNDTDAHDELAKWFFKHPNHGTRTASLVIGGTIKPPYANEGNQGILYDSNNTLLKLIPYRIAKTVVLLGGGKELVSAVNHAVSNNADIIFMCMGSYPRPMMEKAAKLAYDNGVIWVCAAGNEVEMVVAPALYAGTIAVAAINPDEKPWSGTSYGPAVDIAAPGESVYVPFVDKDGQEIMAYGDGTSYATPHVAAAAALWKARYSAEIKKYPEKWQVVEAFRYCLQTSARKPDHYTWKENMYGKGILNIDKLLQCEPPPKEALTYAYKDVNGRAKADLGVREAIHFLWNTLKRKVTPGHQESTDFVNLTGRGRTALTALIKSQPPSGLESASPNSRIKSKQILNDYFESFQR
ncbi:S8 family serine peptidase [Adhaeribacter pallidiroseus]|uniref:Serine protease n=1 Tax=Adhaeribacter pallidiroseus TaxID=2072847 RepID=A0A369QJM0_9BACT|nr:S8 family serine peptidase [Adhaeribacter pallidiroseus]RDC62468.1 hypothetical protein AHMF7616_01062 [Adhaeribacter pallidiroseus]